MESNDFDFESDYDPQEDSQINATPPFESGDAGVGLGGDDFGSSLDDAATLDSSMIEPHDIDLSAMQVESPQPTPEKKEKPKKLKKDGGSKVAVGFSLLFGVVLGVVYGYFVNPIQWVDAGLYHLRADLQEDYVRAVIDSFELTDNGDHAIRRLNELGFERSAEILALIAANPGGQNIGKIQQLSALVSSDFGGGQVPAGDDPGSTPADPGVENAGGGLPTIYLVCIVLALVLVVVAIILYLRKRSAGRDSSEMPTATMDVEEYSNEAPQTNYAMGSDSQPISQWMTTYLIGDDLFDDSFSIDNPSGEFMGECGVGIADTIGVGEPKRVSAFEIWLFDKNDIQTVTKVLMSEHAFSDEAISSKLAAKGDPEMALTGHEIVLETATLQMIARVVDMTYGAGSMPDNSFFERMTIELAVWQK